MAGRAVIIAIAMATGFLTWRALDYLNAAYGSFRRKDFGLFLNELGMAALSVTLIALLYALA